MATFCLYCERVFDFYKICRVRRAHAISLRYFVDFTTYNLQKRLLTLSKYSADLVLIYLTAYPTHFRAPLGVCAGITPFNFPAMIPLWMFPLANVAGNTYVLKPSERDPGAAMMLAELAIEAGLPKGISGAAFIKLKQETLFRTKMGLSSPFCLSFGESFCSYYFVRTSLETITIVLPLFFMVTITINRCTERDTRNTRLRELYL